MATGWDNGLCQDYHRGLGKWFADRPGARHQLKINLEKPLMKTLHNTTYNPLYPWRPQYFWDHCHVCFENFDMTFQCHNCGSGSTSSQIPLNNGKPPMKTIKVSEATAIQLDWQVTHIEGIKTYGIKDWLEQRRYTHGVKFCTDWAHGGPIIEREALDLSLVTDGNWRARHRFDLSQPTHIQHGPTPLIAAMRCYVTSKLGDEVEIPEELA
jgi:hypothetical protein